MEILKLSVCLSIAFFCLENSFLTVDGLTGEGSGSAAISDFPSFATLMEFSMSVPVRVLCSGTVVTGIFVLSTAHCMDKVPLPKIRVYLDRGRHFFTQEMNSYTYDIASWTSYSKWAREHNEVAEDDDPDIAVIRLSKAVEFQDNMGLALLPFDYHVPIHKLQVSLVGWKTNSRFLGDQNLLTGIVETKAVDSCAMYLKQPYLRNKLEEGKLFCTLPQPHLNSLDEGGPVFYNKRVLVGINYWESHCKSRDKKNLHINIHYYKDFVNNLVFDANPSWKWERSL